MSNKSLPKVGDIITITSVQDRPNGEKVHPVWVMENVCASRWSKLDGTPQECRCIGNTRMRVEEPMLVEQIIWYADNSIEAHGILVASGKKWHTMLEAPKGDVCF
jgi:hypothetical protein